MNGDLTLPQVRRMRRHLMHEYAGHLQHHCRCATEQDCYLLMDVLVVLMSRWTLIDIELQRTGGWPAFDRESEGV